MVFSFLMAFIIGIFNFFSKPRAEEEVQAESTGPKTIDS
jgi:hypothetical protein